jgi:signal transduction histidine kinase
VNIENNCDQLLDSHTTQTLFSIVTETLNNARKHAKASLIQIHMGIRQDTLVLGIKDDGVGFDVEQALLEAREREGHLGLINLYERATLIEGTLKIDSEPGSGTLTSVAIPVKVLRARKEEEAVRQPKTEDREVHLPI